MAPAHNDGTAAQLSCHMPLLHAPAQKDAAAAWCHCCAPPLRALITKTSALRRQRRRRGQGTALPRHQQLPGSCQQLLGSY